MALNGITFDKRTVKAVDDGIVRQTLAGKDGILYGLGITYSGLNVTLAQGYFMAAGCLIQNDADLTLPITASGNTYARLRFKIDLTIAASATSFTQGSFIWDVDAAGSFDALVQDDIYDGDDVYEIEFCVVQITSSVVATVTRQLSQIRSVVDVTPLRFINTSVTTSSWNADVTYADYGFRKAVTLTGVTATMIPDVVFAPAEAASGNYASVAVAYAGGIYLYAKAAPAGTITIPTITVWKAV